MAKNTRGTEPERKDSKKRRRNTLVLTVLCLILIAALVVAFTSAGDWLKQFAAGFMAPQAVGNAPAEIAEGELLVAVLDTGQSDCAVIVAGDTTVMIDAGDQYSYDDISGFLRANGITRLDYVFNTHPHTDHMGSLASLIQNYDIGEIVMIDVPYDLTPTNSTYLNLLDTIDRYDVPVSIAQKGDSYELGLGSLSVLSAGGYDDLNNCSMVLKLSYGRTSFLFMGDAESAVERDLVRTGADLSCDVLKVGHHGSYKATSSDFLRFVAPRYAVIPCGAGNSYGFPHSEVLERLERQGAEVLRTDLNGDVLFTSDGFDVALAG